MFQFERRQSLPKPDVPTVSWEEYINAPVGQPPCIGRPYISKESNKVFKATIAMVSMLKWPLSSLHKN